MWHISFIFVSFYHFGVALEKNKIYRNPSKEQPKCLPSWNISWANARRNGTNVRCSVNDLQLGLELGNSAWSEINPASRYFIGLSDGAQVLNAGSFYKAVMTDNQALHHFNYFFIAIAVLDALFIMLYKHLMTKTISD